MANFSTTEERCLYGRMVRMLLDVTGLIMQTELEKHIPRADLKSRISLCRIKAVKSKAKIFNPLIVNAHIDGYSKFDISFLYTLLRNLCGIPPPGGGWDVPAAATPMGTLRPTSPISGRPFPSKSENSLGDDIERIHLTRNDLEHLSSASLTNSQFQFYFTHLEDVCKRMDIRHSAGNTSYHSSLLNIQSCPMDNKDIQIYINYIGLNDLLKGVCEESKKERLKYESLTQKVNFTEDTVKILSEESKEGKLKNKSLTQQVNSTEDAVKILSGKHRETEVKLESQGAILKKLGNSAMKNLLDQSRLILADYRKHGKIFVRTNLFERCEEILKTSRSLLITGNPGEGKTRYAIELLCSLVDEERRLFLNDPSQMEKFDINDVDGIVIDNVYGDVTYDDQHWKSWKRKMEYLIPHSKNRDNFYLLVTSRSWIARSSGDYLQKIPDYQLLSSNLDIRSKIDILNAYGTFPDSLAVVEQFHSDIGFPQICYLYSTRDEFKSKGVEYFRNPQQYIIEFLSTLQEKNPVVLFSLMLIVLNGGFLCIFKFESLKTSILSKLSGVELSRQTVHQSLTHMVSTFVRFDVNSGVYTLSHDSLFEILCSFLAKMHPDILVKCSTVSVLINFVRIMGQEESFDGFRVHINNIFVDQLVDRYAKCFEENNKMKIVLNKSDALFSNVLLSKFLERLSAQQILKKFLRVAEEEDSVLVELCNTGKESLCSLLVSYLQRFSDEKWLWKQYQCAVKRCEALGYERILNLLQKLKSADIDDSSDLDDDGFNKTDTEDNDHDDFLYENNDAKSFYTEALKKIKSGQDISSLFSYGLPVPEKYITASLVYCQWETFTYLMKRAILSEMWKCPSSLKAVDIDFVKAIREMSQEQIILLNLYLIETEKYNSITERMEIYCLNRCEIDDILNYMSTLEGHSYDILKIVEYFVQRRKDVNEIAKSGKWIFLDERLQEYFRARNEIMLPIESRGVTYENHKRTFYILRISFIAMFLIFGLSLISLRVLYNTDSPSPNATFLENNTSSIPDSYLEPPSV